MLPGALVFTLEGEIKRGSQARLKDLAVLGTSSGEKLFDAESILIEAGDD